MERNRKFRANTFYAEAPYEYQTIFPQIKYNFNSHARPVNESHGVKSNKSDFYCRKEWMLDNSSVQMFAKIPKKKWVI